MPVSLYQMPQIFISHTDRTRLFVWHIIEDVATLKSLLPVEKTVEVEKMASIVHQKQFLAKQILLHRYGLTDKITYLPSGKPVCEDNNYISISHSGEYVVVAFSQEPAGVDIERKNPKLQKISSRFQHPDDILPDMDDKLKQWQFLWTAKESVYKLAGISGLSFKQDIRITTFDKKNLTATALLKNKRLIDLYFYLLKPDYVLCAGFYGNDKI